MTKHIPTDLSALDTIFHECNQCGTCCKQYKKISLQEDEVERIKKLGGHVGYGITLTEIREKGLTHAQEDAAKSNKVFMIHPDDQGCKFLQKANDKYYCKIYHYRPRACKGFICNMADDSFLSLFGDDSIHLIGETTFGLPLPKK
ncbi:MAG: YkgJ family cysteine cluster protein [Desulfobulbaceae bacterium]|nr:MAG: YkgJ family cysteine cluster protein [Desulfobulbaceae bacterium]